MPDPDLGILQGQRRTTDPVDPVEIECPICHAYAEHEEDHCEWCQDKQYVLVVPAWMGA